MVHMKIYSVTEYRQELNELLGQVTVAIEGEITSLNTSQGKFIWFTLSDDACAMDCFMLQYEMRVQLEEGMRIRVVGSPNMFKKGKVVFRPRKVELIGDGDLQRAFALLKTQLEKEGLFDTARKRTLPKIPQRVGIVTSRDAAAYTDILRIIQNRWAGVEMVLAHVQVQGADAATSIVRGLEQLYAHSREQALDCIILTRGGGSAEDLQAFNDEEVVRTVYASPIPLIAAIGHERDVTLVDFAADVRASTPSNAAELLVPHYEEMIQMIDHWMYQLSQEVALRCSSTSQRSNALIEKLARVIHEPVRQFGFIEQSLLLAVERVQSRTTREQQRLSGWAQLMENIHPTRLLEKGYTITRDEQGAIIRSARQAAQAHHLRTQFVDGEVESSVK
jgi:exodeoxyribonuclease VII large subunit